MWQALVRSARDWIEDVRHVWRRGIPPVSTAREQFAAHPSATTSYGPLRRVVLSDGVGHTLFDEFAAHRKAARGEEETGWVLVGLREVDQAIVLATLPAGADYDAGVAHVRFNSSGQVLASRIVRQQDRRLTILGVVHTHPGSLRHPSDGDYRGDSRWVANLRGKEGVFGIGTADAPADGETTFAQHPKPHVQCLGGLRFSWYTLRHGDANYRPIPVEVTIGPDLARPLHPLWPALEAHADRVDRLCRQQQGLRFEVLSDPPGPTLALTVPLARAGEAVRVLVRNKDVRYYVVQGADVFEVDHRDDCIDRGVYLLLAELAARA